MSSQSSDFHQLANQITQLLKANPSLLAGIVPSTVSSDPPAAAFQSGPMPACNATCASDRPENVSKVIAAASEARVSTPLGVGKVPQDLAGIIDHTLLKADATYADIDQLCDEAIACGFKSVCVNTFYVKRCAQRLSRHAPVVCCVVGFPLGATPKQIKALEARQAIREGAREVDMVINIGALKSGDHKYVWEDIRGVVEAAHERGALCKVIIETALLTDE